MMMKNFRNSMFTIAALAITSFNTAFAQEIGNEHLSIATWSDEVWSTAMQGDRKGLQDHFKSLPLKPEESEQAARFRDSFELHVANTEKALKERNESREEALAEMREHVEAGELSNALRSAVTVQTLSDDLNSAFDDPEIKEIIAWAEKEIPQFEQSLDWLLAQETVYFLRTLYEDTDQVTKYELHDSHLKAINRRVSLLAQYAPHQLHKLRVLRAERMDSEIGEFNPPDRPDWEARVNGIRPEMLKSGLKTAAREHIEGYGWKPLLRGGLEQLKLVVTTKSLSEAFPKLSDSELVSKWVEHIDHELADIHRAAKNDLDSWSFSRILDDLLRMNDQTVQLPKEVIYREFGDGATFELDEYSEIIWPDKLHRFRQATEGAFVGVGILIRNNDAHDIVVVNPLEGTPAYYGGVKPNDIIVEVNGESTVGWSLNDAVDRITGKPNTEVTLGVKRDGEEELVNLLLTRERIKLRSVMGWWKRELRNDGTPDWDWYVDPISRIAYVKITQFTDETYNELADAWREISAEGKPSGLILDVRYNPGGLLSSAVRVSNLFVKEGLIVSAEDKDGKKAFDDQEADPTKAWDLEDVFVVVLVNQGSASASEIVAGCLQAHDAAVVVGERSYGKGSVQTVHHTSRRARMKLTTQYYRLPPTREERENGEPGKLVHKRLGATDWGVSPDIEVKVTPYQVTESLELRRAADLILEKPGDEVEPEAAERPDVHRLLTDGLDPQLETALLILQARALGHSHTKTQHAAIDNVR